MTLSATFVGCLAVGVACGHASKSAATDAGVAALSALSADTGVSWDAVSDPVFRSTMCLFPDAPPPPLLPPDGDPAKVALSFLERYGATFGIVDASKELRLSRASNAGSSRLAAFTQVEGAASVYGAALSVVFDESGSIAGLVGRFIPHLSSTSTLARLSPEAAAGLARADMKTRFLVDDATARPEDTGLPELTIFDPDGSPTLAYSMLLSFAAGHEIDAIARQRIVAFYVVDANSGELIRAVNAAAEQFRGPSVGSVPGGGMGEATRRRAPPTRQFSVLASQAGANARGPYYLQSNYPPVADNRPRLFVTDAQANKTADPVLSSPSSTSWDTANTLTWINGVERDPGSAVDGFYWLGEVAAWWLGKGRVGWNNQATALAVVAHDPTPLKPDEPCSNSAYWDRRGAIHVCPFDESKALLDTGGEASVDLGVLAHEFQHAVNQSAFGFGLLDPAEPGAVDESLGDVFAQFVMHDTGLAPANCIVGQAWVPNGLRNMVNPHQSFQRHQPDFLGGGDPDYFAGTTDPHLNSGISNKAWSLMTFGGRDVTESGRGVHPSRAIGWRDSERLYTTLVELDLLPPAPSFWDLGWGLYVAAIVDFHHGSPQAKATACAWYAVGVFTANDLVDYVHMKPCECTAPPDAGTCESSNTSSSVAETSTSESTTPPPPRCLARDVCAILGAQDIATLGAVTVASSMPEDAHLPVDGGTAAHVSAGCAYQVTAGGKPAGIVSAGYVCFEDGLPIGGRPTSMMAGNVTQLVATEGWDPGAGYWTTTSLQGLKPPSPTNYVFQGFAGNLEVQISIVNASASSPAFAAPESQAAALATKLFEAVNSSAGSGTGSGTLSATEGSHSASSSSSASQVATCQ